jgi:hypothetical protein
MGIHAHLMAHIVTNHGDMPCCRKSVCVVGLCFVSSTAVAATRLIGRGDPVKLALLESTFRLSGTFAPASIGSQDDRSLTQEVRKPRKTENSRLYALRDEFFPTQCCVL